MANCRQLLSDPAVQKWKGSTLKFLHSVTFIFTMVKACTPTEKFNFYILYEFIHLCSKDLICKDSLAIEFKALVPEYLKTWYMLDIGNVL